MKKLLKRWLFPELYATELDLAIQKAMVKMLLAENEIMSRQIKQLMNKRNKAKAQAKAQKRDADGRFCK